LNPKAQFSIIGNRFLGGFKVSQTPAQSFKGYEFRGLALPTYIDVGGFNAGKTTEPIACFFDLIMH